MDKIDFYSKSTKDQAVTLAGNLPAEFTYRFTKGKYSWDSEKHWIVYQCPELTRRNAELLFKWDGGNAYVYLAPLFNFDCEWTLQMEHTKQVGRVKTGEAEDFMGMVKRMYNYAVKTRRAVVNGKHTIKMDSFETICECLSYAIGVGQQAADILDIAQVRKVRYSDAYATVYLRQGVTFMMQKRKAGMTMDIFLDAKDTTINDVISTVHHFEQDYHVTDFSYDEDSAMVQLRMNIETAYDPDIFAMIGTSMLYGRQIANEIKGNNRD